MVFFYDGDATQIVILPPYIPSQGGCIVLLRYSMLWIIGLEFFSAEFC